MLSIIINLIDMFSVTQFYPPSQPSKNVEDEDDIGAAQGKSVPQAGQGPSPRAGFDNYKPLIL